MRNEIAGWMLSQVAAPEQARTIVGDLLEAQLGQVEFWFAVLRTTVSIARHQPRRVFVNLLWFSGQFVYCAVCARMPAVSFPETIAVGLLIARKRAQSPPYFGFAAFLLWASLHHGGRFAHALTFTLVVLLVPFVWRIRLRYRQSNEPPIDDRPVAG